MALFNDWVGYLHRSYQQIKPALLTKLASYAPEITDHSETNPLVRAFSAWAGIAEVLHYYIDYSAREAHLQSCKLFRSGVLHAQAADYRVKAYVASSGTVTFYIDSIQVTDITIPAGTQVQNDAGNNYYTTEEVILLAGELAINAPILQYTPITGLALGVSDGTANQVFTINDTVIDGSTTVKVNSIEWTAVDTFAYSGPTDNHYILTVNKLKEIIVKFGDGVQGAIPGNTLSITVDYSQGLGEDGNTVAGTVTTVVSVITAPTTVNVTNNAAITGGFGIETLTQLKTRIPQLKRTLERAVTLKDYKDVAELYPGVEKALANFSCGQKVTLYISPTGGGIAGASLLSGVVTWMEDKKTIGKLISAVSAGEVVILYEIDLVVKDGYIRADIKQDVEDNLVAFHASSNQEIKGEVQLSDIYEVIETTPGVKYSKIVKMVATPYPSIIIGSNALNWSPVVKSGSTINTTWVLTYIGSNNFELTKDNVFMGTVTVGVLAQFTQLDFTINAGSYTVGDRWQFIVYPYFGTIVLAEFSLPTTTAGSITINATGGI